MKPFTVLFHPRRIWLPTRWGLLVLLPALALLAVVFGRHAADYLSPNAPARGRDGAGARTLVIEGWLDAFELDQAIIALRRGRYDRVLTTGGPIDTWDGRSEWTSYADRAAFYLRGHGVSDIPLIAVAAPASAQDRSFLSAVMARRWLKASSIDVQAIDLYSADVHARRSRLVFQMAFGDEVEIGVMSARPGTYDVDHWWTTSQGAKTVVGEALSLAWTRCCFWPAARGSHEEYGAAPTGPDPAARPSP